MTDVPRSRPEVRACAALCLAASALGCQDYLFEEKVPESVKEAQILRPGIERKPVDILFVVDNSGSMADEQENLARNFDAFINEVVGAGDYQIAVVSTDLSTMDGERAGIFVTTYSSDPTRHALDFNSSACMSVGIDHGCFRGPDAANRVISSATSGTPAQQITAFQNNVRLGSCGAGDEQGLRAMITALNNTEGTGCNRGFLRPDANLVIVIVSDEEDTDSTPVRNYVTQLLELKPASQVRLAMVVGSVDGTATNCKIPNSGTCGSLCQRMPPQGSQNACMANAQCPNGEYCTRQGRCQNRALENWSTTNCLWCSFYDVDDCCSALSGSRYVEFARLIEAEVNRVDPRIPIQGCRGTMPDTRVACLIDSICQESFGDTLARIARELVVNSSFSLNPAAKYPPGVVVRVNGRELVNGVDFEVTTDGATVNIIKSDAVPREGEEVEVYYVIEE